jgi:hypothetical protein
MAYGDYITCCKCGVKLIYDGDRSQSKWWVERFGKEPEIECPNCKAAWVGLTDEEIYDYADKFLYQHGSNYGIKSFGKAIEEKLRSRNT